MMPLVASTRVALPLLPLPRLQKRIIAVARGGAARARPAPLAQVFEEQVDDPLAGFAGLGLALRIEDGDGASSFLRC